MSAYEAEEARRRALELRKASLKGAIRDDLIAAACCSTTGPRAVGR